MLSPAWLPFLGVVVLTVICYVARAVLGSGIASRSYSVWEGLPLGVSGMVGATSRAIPLAVNAGGFGNGSAGTADAAVARGARYRRQQ